MCNMFGLSKNTKIKKRKLMQSLINSWCCWRIIANVQISHWIFWLNKFLSFKWWWREKKNLIWLNSVCEKGWRLNRPKCNDKSNRDEDKKKFLHLLTSGVRHDNIFFSPTRLLTCKQKISMSLISVEIPADLIIYLLAITGGDNGWW